MSVNQELFELQQQAFEDLGNLQQIRTQNGCEPSMGDLFLEMVKDEYQEEYPDLKNVEKCYIDERGKTLFGYSLKLGYYSYSDSDSLTFILVDICEPGSTAPYSATVLLRKLHSMAAVYEGIVNGMFDEAQGEYKNLADLVKAHREDIIKVTLLFCTTNAVSDKVERQQLTFCNDLSAKDRVSFCSTVIDIRALYRRKQGKDGGDIIITPPKKAKITYLRGIETSRYKSYMCVISADYLAQLYFNYGGALLETNVRAYLSEKVKVNKGILATAKEHPEDFFPYNNGISATADSVELEAYGDGATGIIKSLTNFQIINGGQTTATLAHAKYKTKKNEHVDLSKCFVPMKLTIVSDNAFESDIEKSQFLHDIAKYANSQTKVSDTDLNSGHKFYVAIEDLSREIVAPITTSNPKRKDSHWFFERAKKQYTAKKFQLQCADEKAKKDGTKKRGKSLVDDFEKFNPADQKIQIIDLARVLNIFSAKPYFVALGADGNSTRFHKNMLTLCKKSLDFCTPRLYKRVVAKFIVYTQVHDYVENADWYKSNRGNLLQIVTFALSKLVYDLYQMSAEISLDKIWKYQVCSPEVIQLADLYAQKVSGLMYKYAPTDAREYCKRYSRAGGRSSSTGFWDVLLPEEPWLKDPKTFEDSGDIQEFEEDIFMDPHDFLVGKEANTQYNEKTLKKFGLEDSAAARGFLEWSQYAFGQGNPENAVMTARLYTKSLLDLSSDDDYMKSGDASCAGAYAFILRKMPEKKPFEIQDADEFRRIYGIFIADIYETLEPTLPEDVKERRRLVAEANAHRCTASAAKYYEYLISLKQSPTLNI